MVDNRAPTTYPHMTVITLVHMLTVPRAVVCRCETGPGWPHDLPYWVGSTISPPIVVSLIRPGTGEEEGETGREKGIRSPPVPFICSPSTGGRDRRGAPIITMYATDHADFRPSNVGKVLSYLSKVPE